MQKNRNIDIARVRKKGTIKAAHQSDKRIKNIYKVDKEVQSKEPKKNKIAIKKSHKSRNGYLIALSQSIKSVFSSDIFGFSLLRNILSLRVIVFALMPFAYIQLKYLLVLKPDEILSRIRSIVSPDNTFQFMMWGLALLLLIILSWLADSLLLPSMYRFNYQKLDRRGVSVGSSIVDILNNFLTTVSAKIVRLIMAIFGVMLFAELVYASYVIGYGSISNQVYGVVMVSIVFGLLVLFYEIFRHWGGVITSVELYDSVDKYKRVSAETLLRPLSSIGYGLSWAVGLFFTISLSILIVIAEVYLLRSTLAGINSILLLAAATTSLYLLWTIWTASSVGFWTSIVHSRSTEAKIRFGSAKDGSLVGFGIVIIIIMLIIGGYLILAFLFSTQVSELLLGLWRKLPDSVRLNLSKPQ
jgi:hypothetical protein